MNTPTPQPDFIPVNQPLLAGNEKKYVLECLDSGWISSEGKFVAQFEEAFSRRVSRKHGIAVANGSGALDIAVKALGIGPGDEVIMPTFTIISPAASVVGVGAVPVLIDSDPVTWNMDVTQLESRITPRTKAILIVHIYGLPVDMDPVLALARKYGLAIIEDAAEMHGQMYRNRPCGSFGDISTFSFYANKHVTTGEGGMIVTDDARLADRCRSLRNLCFRPERRFVHEELGWNYRLTNIQAALGLAQLERLDSTLTHKRHLGRVYREILTDAVDLELPCDHTDYAESVYWVFGVILSDSVPFDATECMARLHSLGVGTRPFFWPMHEQPVLRRRGLFSGEVFAVAERMARRGFYLPSGNGTSEADAQTAAMILKQVMSDPSIARQ